MGGRAQGRLPQPDTPRDEGRCCCWLTSRAGAPPAQGACGGEKGAATRGAHHLWVCPMEVTRYRCHRTRSTYTLQVPAGVLWVRLRAVREALALWGACPLPGNSTFPLTPE